MITHSMTVPRRNGGSNGATATGTRAARVRGVLLINLGTPDSPSVPDVRKYLAEFLSDPEVIHLPGALSFFNRPLGGLIARLRAPRSAEMYRTIWTRRGSPLMTVTQEQAAALEASLPSGWRVFWAMRYGRPSIRETVRAMVAAGVEEMVVVPMYPQFSGPTTGTALRELYGTLRRSGCGIGVTTRAVWYDDGGYVNAQARRIHEFAEQEGLTDRDTYLLFSAHGLPVSYADRGDPYPQQVRRSVELIVERMGWPMDRTGLAYQSRFGPTRWLEPATDEVLGELCARGDRRVLICPVSFTADCLETLEEIGVRYRRVAAAKGGQVYLCPALNAFEPFIRSLKDLVLRGPSPVHSWGENVRPLRSPAVEETDRASVGSLIMIGTSVRPRLGSGQGPTLRYTDARGLRRVKRSQCEVPALLKVVHDAAGVRESWLWNTCNRFEYYAWLDDPTGWKPVPHDRSGPGRVVAEVRRHLFAGLPPDDVPINVLSGADAWHHLLRTATGLNSRLPGERDVLDQLAAAHRLAEGAGTAGPVTARWLAEAASAAQALRRETDWGAFAPDYCQAALWRVASVAGVDYASCGIVVVGGSTTSANVLRVLVEGFEVPSRQLTLVYRGHSRGGQLKLLRKAVGQGRRVRIQSYDEPHVAQIVAGADVVIFGIDREDLVLSGEQIATLRADAAKPLTVIDFNTFPSTRGLERIDGVALYTADRLEEMVDAFADHMCAAERFTAAVESAEAWIRRRMQAEDSACGEPAVAACEAAVG